MEFIPEYIARGFVWMFAVAAMAAGFAFILSKTISRMRNRASRFVVLFLLGVPFGILYGYCKVWFLWYSRMSMTEALILSLPGALLCAILFTFWLRLPKNSNPQ